MAASRHVAVNPLHSGPCPVWIRGPLLFLTTNVSRRVSFLGGPRIRGVPSMWPAAPGAMALWATLRCPDLISQRRLSARASIPVEVACLLRAGSFLAVRGSFGGSCAPLFAASLLQFRDAPLLPQVSES